MIVEGHDLTVRSAAELLRTGALSAVELTEAALARIEQTEPRLRAYVEVTADAARAAAREADRERRDGHDRGPLHGIPVAVKDIFDVAGLPTRCGSRSRDEVAPARTDAAAVARLRAAGAVIVGKTVTQEFAAGVISAPARNPWDPGRIPGGSSGGSAAAVGSGSCLAALGSDTGGSIRIPASVVGIVGLKPTYGSLSTAGVYPLSWALDTIGPLTRTVEDAALVVDLLAGRDSTDREAIARFARTDRLDGVRLGVPRPHLFDRLQPGVRAAVEAAIATFRDLGAEVVETPWPEAAAARAAAFLLNRIESVTVHAELLTTGSARRRLLNDDLRVRLEAGALIPTSLYLRARQAREVIKQSIARLFAEHRLDAIVTPTTPATAVSAERPVIVDEAGEEAVGIGYTRLTMPFNATGQPALSLPCGFDESGLPVGLQLAGRPFAEAGLCRIGHAYERTAGWFHQRPPL